MDWMIDIHCHWVVGIVECSPMDELKKLSSLYMEILQKAVNIQYLVTPDKEEA
jgi:hypothetical protein